LHITGCYLNIPYTLKLIVSYSITSNSKACIGSSRLTRGKLYLHSYSNFTEPIIETAVVSLNHSCKTAFNGQVFRTLGPSKLRPPLIGVSFKAKLILVSLTNPLTSRHRAEITLNTLIYYLTAECFVFN